MSEIHVALVTPWRRQGGVATYSERLAAVLEEAGVRVTPVPIENTDTANPLSFVGLLDRIPVDADVVHVQFEAGLFGRFGMRGVGAPAFFLALARLNRPVIVTLHEVHSEHAHRGAVGDYLLRGRDFLIERLALRAADATVVHTTDARDVLWARHGDRWRIERMLHPADADAEPVPGDEAKADLEVAGQVALSFGFVEDKKRYEDVIRVLQEFPDLTYLIAGETREDEGEAVMGRCRRLAAYLGVGDRVRYLGYVEEDDVPVVFSAADVVVLPYERVSQSGVVNEALAYNRPVITSSLPTFEELREEFGCLLTYEEQEELAAALDAGLYDETERMRLMTAAESYVDETNWETFAERTRALYEGSR